MSHHRSSPKRGFANEKRLPRGPNGRCLCRRCGTEVAPPRRTFCSDACVHEWKLRTQPEYVRRKLFERDHGVCAICRLDTVAELRALLKRTIHPGTRMGHLWHADHALPVVEGGGECSMDNFRTLCPPCHKRETAKLATRRAAARRQSPSE